MWTALASVRWANISRIAKASGRARKRRNGRESAPFLISKCGYPHPRAQGRDRTVDLRLTKACSRTTPPAKFARELLGTICSAPEILEAQGTQSAEAPLHPWHRRRGRSGRRWRGRNRGWRRDRRRRWAHHAGQVRSRLLGARHRLSGSGQQERSGKATRPPRPTRPLYDQRAASRPAHTRPLRPRSWRITASRPPKSPRFLRNWICWLRRAPRSPSNQKGCPT